MRSPVSASDVTSSVGRRTGATGLRPAARRPRIVVAGSSALAVRLARRPDLEARAFQAVEDPLADADLLITVGASGEVDPVVDGALPRGDMDDLLRSLQIRARDRRLTSLHVELDGVTAMVGPTSVAGEVGCSHCARSRIRASRREPFTAPSHVDPARAVSLVDVALSGCIPQVLSDPRRSDLTDHVLVIDLATASASRHRVIPLADCEVCGGARTLCATPTAGRLDPTGSLDATMLALAGWLDPYTGVVSRLTLEQPLGAQAGLPYVATAAPPQVPMAAGGHRELPAGWGKGMTPAGAIISAIGETVERYAASLPSASRVRWSASGDLTGDVLEPSALGPYSDEQYARQDFPYQRYNPHDVHPWVAGNWLDDGSPVWVPATAAYLAMELAPHQLIAQGTSNGLAAGTSTVDAAVRATLELLERDAFLAAWQTGRGGTPVLVSSLPVELRAITDALRRYGAQVELSLLGSPACGHTAMALALGDGTAWPGAAIGIGADLDAPTAVQRAVLELAQTGPYLCRLMRDGVVPVPAAPGDVVEMLDHAAYYFPAERARAFDGVRATGDALSWSDLPSAPAGTTVDMLRASLSAAGIRVAVVDVTAPDVATGLFRVVRAVSPDLQCLAYGVGLERRPTDRIVALGVRRDVPAVHPVW